MPKKTSTGTKVAAGLGVAALAAAAAATYYLSGPNGKKHRKQVSVWAGKAKKEMVQKIKGMKTFGKAAYEKAAKEVLAKYKQAKNIDPKELQALSQEIKTHWNKIAKDVAKLGAKKTAAKSK
ncbi:MAG TPA: hypothetical protein VE973_00480 [Candidatus Limnocylindria bacterium]|nr:hypothetical protein [Candidatus Limnocylindria bacterium]